MIGFILKTITFYLLTSCFSQAFAQNIHLGAQIIKLNGDSFLAISYQHSPHWHTYWKNPGDAGQATQITVLVNNNELNLKALEWPTPIKFESPGGLVSYGYKKLNVIFYYISPKQLKKIENHEIKIYSQWLSCKNICVPEEQEIASKIKNGQLQNSAIEKISKNQLKKIYYNIPQEIGIPSNLKIFISIDEMKKNLLLHYKFTHLNKINLKKNINLITPFPYLPFNFNKETLYKDKNNNLIGIMRIDWDGLYQDPPIPLPPSGQCSSPKIFKFILQHPTDGKTYIIKYKMKSFRISGIETTNEYTKKLINLKSFH